MNYFGRLKKKIIALFRHEKKEVLTEHGNIVIKSQEDKQNDAFEELEDFLADMCISINPVLKQWLNDNQKTSDDYIMAHQRSKMRRIEFLSKHARKRRVRKKNQRRFMRQNR